MSLSNAVAAVPILLTVWGVLTACFVGLLTYRGQLTRYENEQLFLLDQNPNGEIRQSEIVRRVQKIQPLVRLFAGAAGLLTAGIVGIWVADAIQTLRIS
jgi:hypothetical protein